MVRTVFGARLAGGALLFGASQAQAVMIGGVDFPQGLISFADAVVSYAPGLAGADPSVPHQFSANALGAPNYAGVNSCASGPSCAFVSLGVGGELVLRFTDNVLTGSNSSAFDLWVFEVGPDVEDTTVEVSTNGLTWSSVGLVTGSTRGIDIDAFGFGSSSAFTYVRLTDVATEGGTGGATVGADIDALGAISTRPAIGIVPEPATWAMLLLGFAGIGSMLRHSRRVVPA